MPKAFCHRLVYLICLVPVLMFLCFLRPVPLRYSPRIPKLIQSNVAGWENKNVIGEELVNQIHIIHRRPDGLKPSFDDIPQPIAERNDHECTSDEISCNPICPWSRQISLW